jgi:competence protein ComEA
MRDIRNRLSIGLFVLAMLALTTGRTAVAAEGKVNINAAGIEELTFLPRVGEVVAARIVAFREANGAFEAAHDLMLVKGIGERTFELIEPHVSLSGDTTLKEKVPTPRKPKAKDQR